MDLKSNNMEPVEGDGGDEVLDKYVIEGSKKYYY